MISKAVQHDLLFDCLDVVTAFLNPAIDKDIHMILPERITRAGTIAELHIVPRRSEYVHQTEHRQQRQRISYLLLNADDIQIQNDHELRPHTTVPRNRYPTEYRRIHWPRPTSILQAHSQAIPNPKPPLKPHSTIKAPSSIKPSSALSYQYYAISRQRQITVYIIARASTDA